MPSRMTVVLVSLLLATPPVIFWLWLVIEPAIVAILCPEECWCDPGGYDVVCSGTSLNTVPLIYLTGVRILSFKENNITFLENETFFSLTELDVLGIYKCGLRTIELGAFNGLTKLTRLHLASNNISEIIPGTFENLKSLRELLLNYNRIEHLDSDVFSGLFNLKYIYLGSNNLQYLHPNTFLRLPNLQMLHLSSNPTLQIPNDRNFINSHSLLYLYISYCNVSSVSVETFANVSALEWLDLSHSSLRTIGINILRALPKLATMYLDGNPLQCDCQLQEVWRWCEDRDIQTEYEYRAAECDPPSEVQGKWWGVLENGQCLEGNIMFYGDYNSTIYRQNDTEDEYDYEYYFHNNYLDGNIQYYGDYFSETDSENYKYDVHFIKRYQVALCAAPFIFGTISNVILLIIIICNKDMRTVPNMYIVNLAISDIIYLMVLFSESCANRISGTLLKGEFMCTFLPFCRRMSVGLSAYSVAVFSFQRYRVTVNPLHVRVSSQATWRVTVATICGVWIVAALFAVPSALSKYLCKGFMIKESRTYYQRVVIFELVVSCVLPLCVIAFSYVMTACHLVESSRFISEGTQNPQLETRRNTARTVVGLTVVFMISYVPYHAFWTYFFYNEQDPLFYNVNVVLDHSNNKFQYSYLISTCFLLINSCLNPVALFCTSSQFRQHLKRYLTCFYKTSPPPTDFEVTRRN